MKNLSASCIEHGIGAILCTFFINTAYAQEYFSGEWRYADYTNASKTPHLTFDIKLTQGSGGKINGSYCIITQNGNRIDCDPDGSTINITGWGVPDSNSADVHFYSFFGAKNGVAKLSRVGDDLIWRVTKDPDGDFFYGPYKAELKKAPVNHHSDERQVVVNKAYLYNSPLISSATNDTYLIKGDHVELLRISDDLKFWRVRYIRSHRAAIERWIDCGAIDFCP